MFVHVASYRLGTGSVEDLARRVEEGNLPVLRETPGFRAYYAIDVGDGVVASVIVFDDAAAAEEADSRLADWVEQTTEEFRVTPEGELGGEVFASARAR